MSAAMPFITTLPPASRNSVSQRLAGVARDEPVAVAVGVDDNLHEIRVVEGGRGPREGLVVE